MVIEPNYLRFGPRIPRITTGLELEFTLLSAWQFNMAELDAPCCHCAFIYVTLAHPDVWDNVLKTLRMHPRISLQKHALYAQIKFIFKCLRIFFIFIEREIYLFFHPSYFVFESRLDPPKAFKRSTHFDNRPLLWSLKKILKTRNKPRSSTANY